MKNGAAGVNLQLCNSEYFTFFSFLMFHFLSSFFFKESTDEQWCIIAKHFLCLPD